MLGKVEEFPNGVAVFQATDEPRDASDIYCEACYCSPDSRCFVYARHLPPGQAAVQQFVACEFGTWEKAVVGETDYPGAATMAKGRFYYLRSGPGGERQLVRLDLARRQERVLPLPPGLPLSGGPAVSPDEQYLACFEARSFSPQMFAINLVELRTGRVLPLHQDPYICNPHHQFEPSEGRFLMVQHNRGCEFAADGTLRKLVGREGATLFFIEVPSGRVIRPAIGPPHTHSISGHETWMGSSGELILTLNVQQDYDRGKGPVLGVRPDGTVRPICPPYQANHIGMDALGRLFAADSFDPDEIVVGCPRTGRTAVVGPARSRYVRRRDRPEYLTDHHPHPYVSADLKWVIFNSDRNGVQQVYAARLPDDLIGALMAGG